MGFTNAQIATDIGNIFSDLEDSNAVEEITHTNSDSETDTFDIIRAKTLSARDLQNVGWARSYKLSVYSINGSGTGVSLGDTFTFSTEGILRVLDISRGPVLGYIRFDMGDQFSGM